VVGGLLLIAASATAQQRLSFTGFVQWISGSSMQVVADNGASVRVELRLVDQPSYNTLRAGDPVRVFGYVSPDRSRLIGERIDRIDAPNVYDSCSSC
jgi:endonuclease YncB( thermonuclease family)